MTHIFSCVGSYLFYPLKTFSLVCDFPSGGYETLAFFSRSVMSPRQTFTLRVSPGMPVIQNTVEGINYAFWMWSSVLASVFPPLLFSVVHDSWNFPGFLSQPTHKFFPLGKTGAKSILVQFFKSLWLAPTSVWCGGVEFYHKTFDLFNVFSKHPRCARYFLSPFWMRNLAS